MGEKLRRLRIEKGLTQKQVADAIGLTTNAIGNYETGVREPSIEIIIKLCKFFDTTSDYLIGLSDSY